ncbi:helix-turn-helix domain-containing protein [Paenibacillus sp. MY03]|uniref:helix-turn-helix domain-containing protein n=1 Tax=Paenibacillus sp. MY03 TaxID=302980 RepID=UPI0015C5F32F|nr:helix-turn-helix domain-containing protein [Paenibacillus sp. MY03]
MNRFRQGEISLSLFATYFLSYMLVFLIPFVAISSFIYTNSVNSLRDEIIRSNIHKLEQVRDMTDLQISQLANMAATISLDHRLTPYMVRHAPTDKLAVEELQRHRAGSVLIENLILYYLDSEEAYSPGGTGSLNLLLGGSYPIGGSFEAFREFLTTLSHPLVLPAPDPQPSENSRARGQLIAYVHPVSFNYSSPYGAVLFLIRESVLSDLISNILGEFHGNVYMVNDKHEILASKDNGRQLNFSDTSRLLDSRPGVTDELIGGRHYSVVTVTSKTSGRSFVAAIPTAQFYSKVADLQFIALNMLALTALVGLGTAMYLTFRQYRPIRNLSRYLGDRQKLPAAVRRQDEFLRIRDSFDNLFRDSEQLRVKMLVQQPFVRDQCLLRLLQGEADSSGTKLTAVIRDLRLQLPGPCYFVAVLSFHHADRTDERAVHSLEQALRLLTKWTCPEGIGYGVELIHDQAIALIVTLHDADSPARQRRYMTRLVQRLQEQGQLLPTIGVGQLCNSLSRINRSFIEATAALQHTLINGQSCVIYFDEMAVQSGSKHWYSDAEKMKWTQSLRKGDFTVSREALRIITGEMLGKDVPVEQVKCMCFDLINVVLRTMAELDVPLPPERLKTLVAFRSVQELEVMIETLMLDICDAARKHAEERHHHIRDGVLQYILHNYKQHELNLETTAQTFQLSVSYLSRLIKEQTGATFTQSVWRLRLEEAKRQLQETSAPIKDIVTDIGYLDTASFISRFRKAEGMTPGQYREQHAPSASTGSEARRRSNCASG